MRKYGRKFTELRPISIIPHYSDYAEGSVLISQGGTKILCNATIQEDVPKWILTQGKVHGWVTAEYAMLPRATQQRKDREILRPSGRSMEIQRLVGRSLRASLDLSRLGNHTIIIDCDVLQADGGTRTTAINGGYIALRLAVNKYIANGIFSTDPLTTEIVAVSVGVRDGEVLLDLDYDEDSTVDVDANIVMDGNGNFIEIQCTAEGIPINRNMLENILNLGASGCYQIVEYQREFLRDLLR